MKILGGVFIDRVYASGDEQALAEVITEDQITRLTGLGVIEGDWTGVEEEEEDTPWTPPVAEVTATSDPATITLLPTGFPARMELMGAGFNSVENTSAATDEQLLAVSGVGASTLAKIRAALE